MKSVSAWLRELAAIRVRFGYRRLTVMLRREGWRVNPKRVYRLDAQDIYCDPAWLLAARNLW